MRILLLISILSILGAGEPEVLEAFVVKYFMLSKSKMEYSPTAWQDTREGYFRAYGSYKASQVLDSLDMGTLSHYKAGIRHFKGMDKIRIEVNSGKDFDHVVKRSIKLTFNVNYFSSTED